MKKRLTSIFIIAALTAGGIILFQVYWVYQTYKTGEGNFRKLVTSALQSSIDAYQIQRTDLPYSLRSKMPYLSVAKSVSDTNAMSFSKGPKPARASKNFSMKFEPFWVTPEDLETVRLVMAKLAAQSMNKPIDIKIISDWFRKGLLRNDIPLDFRLLQLTDKRQLPAGAVAVQTVSGTKKIWIAAIMDNTSSYLFRQNLPPALISLLLVALSAGSLWYMGIIIQRQVKLDDLKNDFISNISHELRTPIAILQSTNEALYKFGQIENIEKAERYLRINAGILNKMNFNVDRLLDISRYEHGTKALHISNVKMDSLIADIIRQFSFNDEATIRYESSLENDEVYTDGSIIDTIVTNLLDNALKYALGKVNVIINTASTSEGWQLQIDDNGPGISKEYLPLIFDKFYRVHSNDLHDVKGYGLGLTHVKQLVNTLKGSIYVKSQVGVGTTFTIQFPAA